MIPVYKPSDPTAKNQLAQLASAIDDLNSLLLNQETTKKYDITEQVPVWVVYEKQYRTENNQNTLTIFDFAQKYYDWLYSDESNGAQYALGAAFLDHIDIDKSQSMFLEKLAKMYADGFNPDFLEKNGGKISEDNLRKFLNRIRNTIYQKKTTEDAIRYFFIALFGIDEEDISIDVPKKNILRLNGGRFYDAEFGFRGVTGDYEVTNNLAGSYLNGSRLQDSNWIQDWSYLVKTGVNATDYKDLYKEMMHPAGIRIVYEHLLSDYQGPLFDEEDESTVCEYPVLSRYAGYTLGFDYSNSTSGIHISTGWSGGVEGITLVGVPSELYCSTGHTGFCGPTDLFPNWTIQNDVFNFFDINISTMFELCYPPELGSPNEGNECSGFIGPP